MTVSSFITTVYAQPAQEVVIGVLAHRGEAQARKMWEPTAQYLNAQLPGYSFSLLPLSLTQMGQAVSNNQLDFVLTNTGNYVNLEAAYDITRVATLKNMRQGKPYTAFGAVIFVRDDRADIQTLEDLHGKSFAAVAKGAFGGFQMAWREFNEVDIDPFSDFSRLDFMKFPQDKIVISVLEGKADAGTVRTDTLERMAKSGVIKLSDFRILNQQHTEGFPFLHSTRLYPEWPFARTVKTSDSFATQVVIALLKLTADDVASKAGLNAGWTVPLSYHGVHDMFKQLKIGPYASSGKVTLKQIIIQYRNWLLLFVLGLAFAVYHYIRVDRLVDLRTQELSEANQALSAHREKLEHLVKERTGDLKNSNDELQEKIVLLQKTQNQLVQTEKMAALGSLVAGFSHEINTPLGIGVTSATSIQEEIQQLSSAFSTGDMKRSDLDNFIEHTRQASDILLGNLTRASELIRSFKQVAVDQSSDEWRTIDLHEYIDEIILSLKPKWKNTSVELINQCSEDITIFNHPGVIYQILSNLIINALIYAFDEKQPGQIVIEAWSENNNIKLDFKDNGKGIAAEHQKNIFDPFFTTRRGSGGSGLGLNIVYTLITGTLKGTINLTSRPGEGTVFHIVFPYQSE